jgi:hypothetical protein
VNLVIFGDGEIRIPFLHVYCGQCIDTDARQQKESMDTAVVAAAQHSLRETVQSRGYLQVEGAYVLGGHDDTKVR